MLVVDSHGEGEALVNRLHDAEVAAELVPFEYLAGVMRSVDAVLIEALACGPDSVLCVGGSRTVVDVARAHDKAVTLVAGVGTRLPDPLWRGMVDALVLDDWRAGLDVIDARVFARIVGPTGVSTDFSKSFVAECAAATELLRRSVI